jgi:hypothetical protein
VCSSRRDRADVVVKRELAAAGLLELFVLVAAIDADKPPGEVVVDGVIAPGGTIRLNSARERSAARKISH